MAAPSDSLGVADLSRLFGGTELTDAIGHVILFSVLTFAWYFAIRYRWNARTAFIIAVAVVGLLGTVAELSQHFVPHRGMTLLDLLANWSGVVVFMLMCKTVNNRLKLDA
jgi:VanZ family protein